MRRVETAAGTSQRDRALVGFLKQQRWFGDKGREIRRAELVDAIPVVWPNSTRTFAVARVRVETDAGHSLYQVFLDGSADADRTRIEDVLDDPEFLRGLADAWAAGADFRDRDTRWVVASEGATPLVIPPAGKIRPASGEQTNSSIILNEQAILKLFRKLEPGINPDVEVTRFLTIEQRFLHVPALLGTIRFEDPRGTTVAGMLQEFIPGATDAWTHVVDQLKAITASGDAPRRAALDADIEQLGAVTRALHDNLAAGERQAGFGMARATRRDLGGWIAAARRTIESAAEAMRRALEDARVPRELEPTARGVVRALPATLARLERLPATVGDDIGGSTRTHGDYHLGQVLRSAAGPFFVIDFEGEPARPLAERRARTSPLRDVAGMLRSFAYAAAVAAMETKGSSEERDDLTRRSYQRMRERFLSAYRAAGGAVRGLLPSSDGELLSLFELEKQFYEVQYELDHRPDWLWVPLHDLARAAGS